MIRFNRLQLYSFLGTIISATAATCVGELLINRIYFKEFDIFPGTWLALAGNIIILYCFIQLLFALTGRLRSALAMPLTIYGLLIAADIIKLTYFDNPIRPTDLQYVSDLRVIAKSYLNPALIALVLAICMAIAAVNILLWKRRPATISIRCRIILGTAAAVAIFCIIFLPSFFTVRGWLSKNGIELPESWQFEPRASARANGLLVDLAMSAMDPSFSKPEQYNRAEIERIARAYQQAPGIPSAARDSRPPDVIMFLIESFMDPQDLGIRFTSDPIPTFHKISRECSSGRVVVPVFGGTSANTEFELLTGLSMYFLPEASCPYRQYLNQDIPSLPRELHRYGYRTTAILADPPYLFNRRAAFRHLGFDQWRFPEADPKTPRSIDNAFASDEAIVDAVISESRGSSPYFMLAFTGGSHFPWDYSAYDTSELDIAQSFPEDYRHELKTYINALHTADNALNKLISYFEKSDRKTTVLIMGDHMPALTSEIYDHIGYFPKSGLDKIMKRHQTPIALWSNFPTPKNDFVCSANFITVRLLQFLGLEPTAGFKLFADVYSRFPVFSQYEQTADGRVFAARSPELPYPQLVKDLHLINYDLLIGKQYALEIPGWK
jgi:hypothetical protein